MSRLLQQWYKKSWFCYLLLPLSILYRFVIFLRLLAYRYQLKKTTHFPVPIIVVGNITVGGTGKTPIIIWLANFLRENGYAPGIVSRGYGGKAKHYPQLVMPNSDPVCVGDEPVLLAIKTNCPVVVAPDRVAAVTQLLRDHYCNIVLSDDGLQHYALGRALEIAVVNNEYQPSNNFCLPAGPLREPKSRLDSVDFVVENKRDFNLVPGAIYNLLNPELEFSINEFKNKKIHAVAGIGNPQRFFQMLRSLGLNVIEHPFSDHHKFTQSDFKFVLADEIVIITEKDMVKCLNFVDVRFWCLPVTVAMNTEITMELCAKLNSLSQK